MIYQPCTYRGAIRRYSPVFSVRLANINLHLKDVTEIQLTEREALMINSLRGLYGKKAKLRAFRFFIDHHNYTFEQLAEIFPTYAPDK